MRNDIYDVQIHRKANTVLFRPMLKNKCRTCGEDEELPEFASNMVDDPYICAWCISYGERSGLVKNRYAAMLDVGVTSKTIHDVNRAHAVYTLIEREFMTRNYQRRTGKMGDHLRWQKMTPEQRKAYSSQPAPHLKA